MTGAQFGALAQCVTADNPGPLTLDGTNTWLLAASESAEVVVVDPGPDEPDHLSQVVDAVAGRRVAAVLLTHSHADHSASAAAFARSASAPLLAADPALRTAELPSTVDAAGLRIGVLATPGHTRDSVCFLIASERLVLTGDTVLGRGTSLIDHPEGSLGDYLDSLQLLHGLATAGQLAALLPGHGPVITDPVGVLRMYREHRADRLEQVRQAVAAGARTVEEVVSICYLDVPEQLWPAAGRSVAAQMHYLGLEV